MAFGYWRPYVSVAQQRAQAQREMKKLRKKGVDVCPIEIEGRIITRTFWGDAWCEHLEQFSDYANRLPRGKRYVRNGSVCHMEIQKGKINAMVSGSELYDIKVAIKPLAQNRWKTIKQQCMGQIGSLLELLEGKLSANVMAVVTHPKTGLFPQTKDIALQCNCPDWADLCKHLAAVLYGVGALLDKQPELLFTLRGVDHEALISTNIAIPTGSGKRRRLDSDMSDVFGIELDNSAEDQIHNPVDETTPTKNKRVKTKQPVKRSPARSKSTQPTRKKPFNPTSAMVSRLRKRLGINTAQFAQLIGVSPAAITRWENSGDRLNLQARSKQALAVAVELEKSAAWEKLGLEER
ncbi:MAG: helix-turn-helix domain-containing protein [Pseudomonadales bacterium]